MKPIEFAEANSTLGGGPAKKWGLSSDVQDLSVYKADGQIISCWQPNLRERLSLLFGGRVWLFVVAARTHAPVGMIAARTVFQGRPEVTGFESDPIRVHEAIREQKA